MPVCIAGMHRSGTSMVASLLRRAGLYLGEEADLLPSAEGNPDGYFENRKFVDLNEELLSRLGGTYFRPPAFAPGWAEAAAAALGGEARAVLRGFAGREPWGWKDPRNSLTLPFWLSLLPEMRVIICLRNPLEVALSERRRWERLYALNRPRVSPFHFTWTRGNYMTESPTPYPSGHRPSPRITTASRYGRFTIRKFSPPPAGKTV